MKLINKISNRLLFNSFIIIVFLGVLSFFLIDYILENEVNEQLVRTKDMIVQGGFDRLPNINSLTMSVRKVVEQGYKVEVEFKDTLIFNNTENENEEFRQLTAFTKTNNGIYKIIVRSSLFEKEDLLITILFTFLFVYLLLSLSLYIINRKTTVKIFKPFQEILDQLKSFKLTKETSFSGSESTIDEFNLLNENLISLTERVSNEYRRVREFTDNASHEIQTPLAVIKSKLELLVQNGSFSEDQSGLIQTIMRNVNKLSRLNKSLLLLARIEGNQFNETEETDIRLLLEKELSEFSDLITLKNMSIQSEIVSSPVVNANPELLSVMIRNILSNAVIHNVAHGVVKVSLSETHLTVENSGAKPNIEPHKLFERFSKNDNASGTVGLGLAIVKQVCELYNFKITYTYESGFHKLSINFT